MHCTRLLRFLGLGTVGLFAMAFAMKPGLSARQPAEPEPKAQMGAFGGQQGRELDPFLMEPIQVEAPPKTIDELRTHFKLQHKIPMHFREPTPLREVLKYIQQATIDEKYGFPKGVFIFVDPIGLQDADKTLEDTVQFDFDEMRLGKSLRLILRQLSLTYKIDDDGLITVDSISSDSGEPMSNDEANWHAFHALRAEVHALRQEIRELRAGQVPPVAPATTSPGANPQGNPGGFR